MSSVLYPISMIQALRVEKFERVIADAFDNGSTSARSPWPAQYFKRRFEVQHAALTIQEFKYLRAFYAARSGRYDSFYFRDNVNRDGNATVRFASTLQPTFVGGAYNVGVTLEEIAAVRALPEWNEVQTAAGTAPALWWDGSRERWYIHTNEVTETATFDAALAETYRANWSAGVLPLDVYTAYTPYYFRGLYAKTPINFTGLATGQPAATLFCFVKSPTCSSKSVILATGTQATGGALGIALAADNYYEPWLGGAETFANARKVNTATDTWRSLAVVWTGSSNNATLYANTVSAGTDAVARSLVQGPAVMGSALDGTLKLTTTSYVNHAMIIPAALSAAQVKALHNLLCYQHGVASVA